MNTAKKLTLIAIMALSSGCGVHSRSERLAENNRHLKRSQEYAAVAKVAKEYQLKCKELQNAGNIQTSIIPLAAAEVFTKLADIELARAKP